MPLADKVIDGVDAVIFAPGKALLAVGMLVSEGRSDEERYRAVHAAARLAWPLMRVGIYVRKPIAAAHRFVWPSYWADDEEGSADGSPP